jgi:predicted ATPase
LIYLDEEGKRHDAGQVKIAKRGMNRGRTILDNEFETLDASYASLGQSQSYYETLQLLPFHVRKAILEALRDIVWDPNIASQFEDEEVFGTSLLRSIGEVSIEKFRSIVQDRSVRTAFSFNYHLPPPHNLVLSFSAVPSSHPPTNIHVLIGSNGVGKTRMLRDLAQLMGNRRSSDGGINGSLEFVRYAVQEQPATSAFANLITVAFSAFDPFPSTEEPPTFPTPNRPRFKLKEHYVGLKKWGTDLALKDGAALEDEFVSSASQCLNSSNRDGWLSALNTLSSDVVLADMHLREIATVTNEKLLQARLAEVFKSASSGHRIVLLTMTQLVSLVGERSLVLIDEPETHLHPPLQAAFIRALSELLASRNGIAIMATHSPVMLQEVPRECVWMLYRNGEVISASRPEIETFAENVGVLTREVFRLEVTESGFHAMLKRETEKAKNYDAVLSAFSGKVGTEGRTLVRALVRGSET